MNNEVLTAREAALQAHNAAQAIYDKYGHARVSEFDPTDREHFERAMGDASGNLAEYNRLNDEHQWSEKWTQQVTRMNSIQNLPSAVQASDLMQLQRQRGIENPYEAFYQRFPGTQPQEWHQRLFDSVEKPSAPQNDAMYTNAFKRYLAFGKDGLMEPERFQYIMNMNMFTRDATYSNEGFNRHGTVNLSNMVAIGPQNTHTLVGHVNQLGGFTVPQDFMAELIVEMAGFAVMRPLGQVRQTNRMEAAFMTIASGTDPYPSGITGSFRAQGWVKDGQQPPVQNQPQFGQELVMTYIWAPDVIVLTMELLADSAANLDAEIRRLLAITKALDEDSVFINGNGIGMPIGILEEARRGQITTVKSQVSGGITYDGLVQLHQQLPSQYRMRGNYIMNSLTQAEVMLIRDNDNRPLYPINTVPMELFGTTINVSEFMQDPSVDGNYAIIHGDMSFFGIVDREDMRVIRFDERFAPNVGLMALARVGGQVLKSAPFRVLEIGV